MSTVKKPSLLSKISVKKVIGKRPQPDETGTKWLMQVAGIATGFKTGESDYGEWSALTGSFQATNLENEKVYRSGKCFLPVVALNMILPALEAEHAIGVEFAFNIGVVSAETATGYEYVCESVFEISENDPLQMLTSRINKEEQKKLGNESADKKKGK